MLESCPSPELIGFSRPEAGPVGNAQCHAAKALHAERGFLCGYDDIAHGSDHLASADAVSMNLGYDSFGVMQDVFLLAAATPFQAIIVHQRRVEAGMYRR